MRREEKGKEPRAAIEDVMQGMALTCLTKKITESSKKPAVQQEGKSETATKEKKSDIDNINKKEDDD
eukprot:9430646-Prorocentrum_lima.AAC.1